MYGDDLDALGVTLQPQQGGFVVLGRISDGASEPAQQCVHARFLAAFHLQQLGQVQEIGQTPLAVAEFRQMLGDAGVLEPAAEHRHEAFAQPEVMIGLEAIEDRIPSAFVLCRSKMALAVKFMSWSPARP